MIKNNNLKNAILEYLPAELVRFLDLASSQAVESGMYLYLVGGVVRDLLLGRPNVDLDLVVEGDAIELAEKLAKKIDGKLITHSRFNTASIMGKGWNIDIATARVEAYKKPGELPTLEGKTNIRQDLARRDFSINAMAVDLNSERFGELIDIYHGYQDLLDKVVRVLHDASFQDDATRMWRAVRYEQRLDFKIEKHSLELLHRDIDYLGTISGDRIRNELELCLEETQPEKLLARAKQLGILTKLSPAIAMNKKTASAMLEARRRFQPVSPATEIYLGILLYNVEKTELDRLISFLRYPRAIVKSLKDTLELKTPLDALKLPRISNYEIFNALKELSSTAICVNSLMQNSSIVRLRLDQFLYQFKSMRTLLKGKDLIKAGLPPGLQVHGILEMLLAARLNGEIQTILEEKQLAQKISKADFNIDLAF